MKFHKLVVASSNQEMTLKKTLCQVRHDSKAEHLREFGSVLNPTVKGRLQSLVHIDSAHNKGGPNEFFFNLNTGLHSFMSKANQNSARHSVSK